MEISLIKMTEKEKLQKIGLMVFSTLLIVGLFFPWISMRYQWLPKATKSIKGKAQLEVTGIGTGKYLFNFFVKNTSAQKVVVDNFTKTSIFVPSQFAVGAVILGISVLNIALVVVSTFLSNHQIVKKIKGKWPLLSLVEGVGLTVGLLVYMYTYFSFPISLSLSKNIHNFPQNFNNLRDLILGISQFFTYATSSARVDTNSLLISRSFNPGIGIYITWFGAVGLTYIWFITYLHENNWPKNVQKRSILLPLLLLNSFLPIAVKYSPTNAMMVSMFSLPYFVGWFYIVLTSLLIFGNFQTAKLGKNLNRTTADLYAREELTEEETKELIQKVEKNRKKLGKYRRSILPIFLALFITVCVLFYTLVSTYINLPPKWVLDHTIYNWLTLLTPVAGLIISILYSR